MDDGKVVKAIFKSLGVQSSKAPGEGGRLTVDGRVIKIDLRYRNLQGKPLLSITMNSIEITCLSTEIIWISSSWWSHDLLTQFLLRNDVNIYSRNIDDDDDDDDDGANVCMWKLIWSLQLISRDDDDRQHPFRAGEAEGAASVVAA